MATKNLWTPDRGDIIVVTKSGQNLPLLTLSSKAFNFKTGMLIALLATNDEEQSSNPFAIELSGPKSSKKLYALAHNPVTLNWKSADEMLVHPLKKASEDALSQACETLNQIIEI